MARQCDRKCDDNHPMVTLKVEQQLAGVIAAFNAGRSDEADVLCASALGDAVDHPALNHLYAVLRLERGDAPAALAHVQRSLATQPDDLRVLATAVRAAHAAGAPALALQFAARAAGLAPTSVELRCGHASAWYELGRHRYAAGDMQAARHAFEAATLLDAGLVPGWFALSLVLQDLRQTDLAARALERVQALKPNHVEAAVNLGLLRQAQGDLDAAMLSYGQAYRQQPETLGRIAHALCSLPCGAMWSEQRALESALRATLTPPRRV